MSIRDDIKVSKIKGGILLERTIDDQVYQARIEHDFPLYSVYLWRGEYPYCDMVGMGSDRLTKRGAVRVAIKRLRKVKLDEHMLEMRNNGLFDLAKKAVEK